MKKTSLLLAVGALLYGASSVYALPEITTDMSDDAIREILDQMDDGDIPQSPEIAEDEGFDIAVPTGLQPFPSLPNNIAVDSSGAIQKHSVCKFTVDGAFMAEFPVTVNGGPLVYWKKITDTKGKAKSVAVGEGWILVQDGDTWYTYNPWKLYTTVPITTILLEPWRRNEGDGMITAFDIGGLLPRAPAPAAPVHSTGSARGRAIVRVSPPKVTFKATYSKPVYISGHGSDSTDVHFGSKMNNDTPTHDLYGTLKIEFDPPVEGTSLKLDPAFVFSADTDCLPVKEGQVISYNQETSTLVMKILAENDGLAAIMQRCDKDISTVAGPFELTGENENTISTSLKLKSDCCYSLMDLDSLETVKLLGVNTNADDEVCAQ